MKRGKPFEIGNKLGKGRPPGSPNKSTNEARKLFDEHGPLLTKKCIAAAALGNMKAMSLAMDRFLPSRRQPGPNLKLPRLETSEDIAQAYSRIMRAIAKGDCPSAEAQVLADILKAKLDMITLKSVEARLSELEILKKKAA